MLQRLAAKALKVAKEFLMFWTYRSHVYFLTT